MKLADYQRALSLLAFGPDEPSGDMAAFALYRTLIRGRLFDMARRAYRLAWTRVGAHACDASFARYLHALPPKSPLLREVIASYAPFGGGDAALFTHAPFAPDLLRFEAAKWCVADAPSPPPPALSEVDFVRPLVLNPTLTVLSLAHPVDRADDLQTDMVRCADFALLVYRRPEDDDVHWYRASPLFGALVRGAEDGTRALGAVLAEEVAARGLAVDEARLSALAGELAVAVERGVVLGVRA